MDNDTNTVLVSRLSADYDPFRTLHLKKNINVDQYPTQLTIMSGHWSEIPPEWHYGRIRYFRDLFLEHGEHAVDPIEVDNECGHGNIYPQAVLLDGHHRLCGAILAGAPKIRINYGGRVDYLRWLEGKRKNKPEG